MVTEKGMKNMLSPSNANRGRYGQMSVTSNYKPSKSTLKKEK